MSIKQKTIAALLGLSLILFGIANLVAESQPVSLEGRALKIEMDAYIDKFTLEVGITDAQMQWAVLVLPILERYSPAVTYGWLLPPPDQYVQGEPEIWVAMFTFQEDMMLLMEPRMRRVVAGHEVAHMTGTCMIPEPNIDGLDETTALLHLYNHAVILESCADIVSAELTSAEDVLATLHFLRTTWAADNIVLIRRIQVMARVIQREKQNVE